MRAEADHTLQPELASRAIWLLQLPFWSSGCVSIEIHDLAPDDEGIAERHMLWYKTYCSGQSSRSILAMPPELKKNAMRHRPSRATRSEFLPGCGACLSVSVALDSVGGLR